MVLLPAAKPPEVALHWHLNVLLRYTHVNKPDHLSLVWTDLATAFAKDLREILDNAFITTSKQLQLTATVIMHNITKMVRVVNFSTVSMSLLTTGLSAFCFIAKISKAT